MNSRSVNPTFPQQSTADQFFDEAQWESYRRLGEYVAQRLFSGAAPSSSLAAHFQPASGAAKILSQPAAIGTPAAGTPVIPNV